MPIIATSPKVIEAGATYDKVCILSHVCAGAITKEGIKGRTIVTVQRYRELPNGECEADPSGPVTKVIPDVFAKAEQDPQFADALQRYMQLMSEYLSVLQLV